MAKRWDNPADALKDRYVIDENGCWNWTRQLNKSGYGSVRIQGRGQLAHRVSYIVHVGDIPKGLVIDHLCRNPRCINPAHMEVVTQRENIRRGLSPVAERINRTVCKNGHCLPLMPGKRGRSCPICYREKTLIRKKRYRLKWKDRLNERAREVYRANRDSITQMG